MPLLGAPHTPTTLSSGEKLEVLAGENIASGALTMAISLTAQPVPVTLSILNATTAVVALVASGNGIDFFPVFNQEGTAITAATDTVTVAIVASGFYYSLKPNADVVGGIIWIAR